MTSSSFDLVVVGAGTAGTLAAYAAKKAGLKKVLLVDRKAREYIGRKVCGDGIGTKHLNFLQSIGFPIKENAVIRNKINSAVIVAPNTKTVSRIPVLGHLAILNRHSFGQTLLQTAIDAGVRLYDKTLFTGIERENGKVKLTLAKKGTNSEVVSTPLIIDASGVNSRLREDPKFFGKENSLGEDEQYYCYREIIKVDSLPGKYRNKAIFEFSFERTRGGYMWFFSRGNNELNIGCGVPKKWISQVKPKAIYHQEMTPRFKKFQTLEAGGGFVPTRQPLPSFVKDNILLIGDAATLVNPLHGGGLSPSLNTGYLAGKLAAEQIPNEVLTEEALWSFNLQILERYSFRYALLDLYRILLQNIPDDELLQALEQGYFPIGKIFYARKYEKLLGLSRKLGEQWATLPNPRFNLLPNYLERIHTLMHNYPQTAEGLAKWAAAYRAVYQEYQQKIKID